MSKPFLNLSPLDVVALGTDLAAKLDSASAAPAFSATATYLVNDYVTYNGKLYVCVVAKGTASDTTPDNDIYNPTTAPTNHWSVTDMTSPDAAT